MTFVNPFILAGLALIAIPIVLHFVMRHKPKRIEFPALRLVRQRQQASQRRLRLQHLLLLVLRVGLLALLVLALARPSMKLSGMFGSQEAPVAAALVFDTSIRMEYRQENQTRLAEASKLGTWLLQQVSTRESDRGGRQPVWPGRVSGRSQRGRPTCRTPRNHRGVRTADRSSPASDRVACQKRACPKGSVCLYGPLRSGLVRVGLETVASYHR